MTHRTRIVQVLSDTFDFRSNRTGVAVIRFAFATVAVGALIQALYAVLVAAAQCLLYPAGMTRAADPRGALLAALDQLAGPLLFALVIFYWSWRNYRANRSSIAVTEFVSPPVARGLIIMLSTYNRRESRFAMPEDAVAALAAGPLESARAELLKSNWGPLVVAAEHHAPAPLDQCWILCTKGARGSAPQFEAAAAVVRVFAGSRVKCQREALADAHDLRHVARALSEIYREAALGKDLDAHEMIADFTSGTAVMSAGMVLATLPEDRRIEYLRQDVPLFHEDGRALSGEEIRRANALVAIETTPALAVSPDPRSGGAGASG